MTHSILTSTKQQTRHTMTSASMYVCSMCMHVLHVYVLHVHAHMHVCMCMCMCLCVCFLFLQGKVIVHMYKCGKCLRGYHLQFTANSAGQIPALSKNRWMHFHQTNAKSGLPRPAGLPLEQCWNNWPSCHP